VATHREGARDIAADARNSGDFLPHVYDLADTVNALSIGVAIVSPDLRIVMANAALITSLGVDQRDYSGRMLWELLPGQRGAPEAEMILDTARDGVPRSCCTSVHGLTLEIASRRLASAFVVVEVSDCTVEARLVRRYDTLLESITDGFCVLDARWQFTYWNGAAETMTGLRSADIVGRNASVAFGNIAGSQFSERFIETLRNKAPTEIRSWSYEGDARGRAAGIYDAFMYPVDSGGAIVIFREVGQRVRQERELHERRVDAEALHSLVRSIAAVTDSGELRQLLALAAMESCKARGSAVVEVQRSQGVITAAAGESLPLVGNTISLPGSLTERVIREKRVVEVLHYASEFAAHQQQLVGELMGPALATSLEAHGSSLGVLVVSRAPGAQRFSPRAQERLRVMADHAALGLWKLRLVDEAQTAIEAKNDFLSAMSHELRTPLAVLTGYGEILSEEVAGPLSVEQHDVVDRMGVVTDHLAGLIDELLTYSTLDAEGDEVEPVECLLPEVVGAAVAAAEPLARDKGIAFDLEDIGDLRVCTDPDKLRQILVHLLSNAVKFTEHGRVRLEVSEDDTWVRLRVIDTGIGIAEEHRPRMFQPFTQLDVGLRRRHRGAGLGLYIAQKLARSIGGGIDYRSVLGQGSEFTVSLPR
jgi:PAS domain S-box-containing protein